MLASGFVETRQPMGKYLIPIAKLKHVLVGKLLTCSGVRDVGVWDLYLFVWYLCALHKCYLMGV